LTPTPAEPAQATLLGSATIQEDIKQAHGHGLRGISRGTSAAELRFCSWKSWFRLSHPEVHTMMSASREKSETAELLEMVQKVSDSSRSPSPRAIQSVQVHVMIWSVTNERESTHTKERRYSR